MIISLIVAYGKNRQIGLDGKLLWHIPEDFKHFKSTTMGHTMVMGRKTFDSIGKPLPGRKTIILSRSQIKYDFDVEVADSCERAILIAESSGEKELFVCGGEEIYKLFLPMADKIYASEVDFDGPADTYFPETADRKWQRKLIKSYPQINSSAPWDLVHYS